MSEPDSEGSLIEHLVELRTADASEYTLGQELNADVFAAADVVDVTGVSKGKGTAGVMKRHGFHGLRASHGVHRKHRSPGSIGGSSTPSKVFKGMRMAGRMGVEKVTVQNLTVHAVDAERGLILVKGSVPGPKGALVVAAAGNERQTGNAPGSDTAAEIMRPGIAHFFQRLAGIARTPAGLADQDQRGFLVAGEVADAAFELAEGDIA